MSFFNTVKKVPAPVVELPAVLKGPSLKSEIARVGQKITAVAAFAFAGLGVTGTLAAIGFAVAVLIAGNFVAVGAFTAVALCAIIAAASAGSYGISYANFEATKKLEEIAIFG